MKFALLGECRLLGRTPINYNIVLQEKKKLSLHSINDFAEMTILL